MQADLSIQLLGHVCISRYDVPVQGLESPRLRALLARIVLTPGVAVDRAALAFDFWPDSTDAQARTNLRKLLHQLLRRLPEAEHAIERNTHSLLWRSDAPYHVDVHHFISRIRRDATPSQLTQAANMYRGPFLPGIYNEWALMERERLQSLYLDVLNRLSSYHENRGEFSEASAWIRQLLLEEPYNEPAWERLIRMYAAAGNRAAALEAYHRCRRVLHEELGVEPSESITKVYEQLLRTTIETTSQRVAETQTSLPRSEILDTPLLPLIGRLRERADVRRWCYRALSQMRPSLVLIIGEAGIGKSRLAEDTVEWASSQAMTVVPTRAYQPDQALAFAPVQGLLRTNALQEAVSRLPLKDQRRLDRLMPGSTDEENVTTIKAMALGATRVSRHRDLSADWQIQELFNALTRSVLAVSQPLLVVAEELHWWDNISINWLHYMLNHAGSVPLVVLATLRPEEDPAQGFPELIAALQSTDQVRHIELAPLTPDESHDLVDEWTNMQPTEFTNADHTDARHDLAQRAYLETNGNPLFLLEWLQATKSGHHDPTDTDKYVDPVSGLPGCMHGIMMSRLLALSMPARQIADAAAVLGRAFPWQIPGLVIDSDEETIVDALEELCHRRVMREHDTGIYDFTHARIRDVVMAQLSTARLRFLHKRAAQALLTFYGASDNALAVRLAEHYEQAGLLPEAAVQYRLAARYFLSLHANEKAVAMYRKGIEAMEASHSSKSGAHKDKTGAHAYQTPAGSIDATTLHLSLWEGLGDVQLHIGHHAEAMHSFIQASRLTPPESIARARLLRKRGNTERALQHYDKAQRWYHASEAALGLAPFDLTTTDSERLTAWVDTQLDQLNLLYATGRTAEMHEISQRMRPVIERSNDWEHRSRYHHSLATMLHRQERFITSAETLAHGKAKHKAARASKDPGLEAEARFSLGFLLLWRDRRVDLIGAKSHLGGAPDWAEAKSHLRAALDWAETTGDLLLWVRSLLYLGFLHRRQGDTEEVRKMSNQALKLARRANFKEYIALALAHRAWVAERHGHLDRVRQDALQAIQLWDEGNLVYPFVWAAAWPLLACELREGRLANSLALAQRVLSPEQHRLPTTAEGKLREAVTYLRTNHPDDAKASLRDALRIVREEGFD